MSEVETGSCYGFFEWLFVGLGAILVVIEWLLLGVIILAMVIGFVIWWWIIYRIIRFLMEEKENEIR